MPGEDSGLRFCKGFLDLLPKTATRKFSSATLLSIANSGSNPWFMRSQAEPNPIIPKPKSITSNSNDGLIDPLVTLPTVMHSSKGSSNLSRNPAKCGRAHPRDRSCLWSKHTLTLSSLMDFCREMWKTQNIIAWCAVYHVRQSKHFQLSRRSLTVASCQTLCFISHLTHDSYSSMEPQAPCRDITSVLVVQKQ